MEWETAEKVQKNYDGRYRAMINGEWVPVEKAQKNAEGKFRVMREASVGERLGEDLKSAGKGALSGVADIGNTLINAATYLPRKILPGLEEWNQSREAGLDAFNKENEDSTAFQGGRIAANIAGTGGVGGVIKKAAVKAAELATKVGGRYAGKLGQKLEQFGTAAETGGMRADGGGMLTRMAGGATTGGAATGLIDPESADLGAGVGAVLPPAVRGAYRAGKGVRSMVEPFHEGGRNKIMGRALTDAAGNQADDAMVNMRTAETLVPGSKPTAGMVAQNPGIAAMERSAMANNPVATNELAIRQATNNEARIAAMEKATPDLQASREARSSAVEGLYDQAADLPVTMNENLAALFTRPSMQGALSRAKKLAEEAGETFDLENLTGRQAQYIKMSLDDMVNSGNMTGVGGNELRAIKATRTSFLDELAEQIPEYLQANEQYATLSRPVTQSQIMGEILNKGTNKISGNITPGGMANAVTDKTAQRVTKQKNARLGMLLEPEQLDTVNAVKQDVLNQNYANTAGRGVGSNTVQNLAYSNMLDSAGVPNFVRNNGVLSTVGNIAGRIGKTLYGDANNRIAAELSEVLLDPKKAAWVMANAKVSPKAAMLAKMLEQTITKSAPAITAR